MPETGNDGRLNQRGSYLSLNYVNIILKLHILTNRTNWLSPLPQIHNRAKRRSEDPSVPDLKNFRACVGTLSASVLGDWRAHLTQNFETYTDQKPVSINFVARKTVLFWPETGNDDRLNQRGNYLSLNYVSIIIKLHILTKWTFWLSPLHHIRNRAKRRSGDPPSPDLTNFRAYVETLSASKLGDSSVQLTQNFEMYTD